MNSSVIGRISIVVLLVAAIAGVFILKGNDADSPHAQNTVDPNLPRLVDLGADKCVACKKMMPILDELKTDFAGQFTVEFIDVWKTEGQAEAYGIQSIPTQIFFDAEGKELFRHTGYFSREDILKTWQQHGFEFTPQAAGNKAS
jgi:thioredoxin 1